MSLFVKICGMTAPETAVASVEAGVDAVGFVFSESPRLVSPAFAASMAETMPPGIIKVAVFRRPTRDEIEAVLAEFQPDLIQADHDTLGITVESGLLPVYREPVVTVSERGRFLYEGPVSGVGHQVDRRRAAEVARQGDMILAGGLTPENVGRAIAGVRPFGVDVSSGVESRPGVKDPALIRSFVAAVRAAEERLVSA